MGLRRAARAKLLPEAAVYCCVGCRLAAAVAGNEDGPRRFLEARLLVSAFLAMGVMTFSLVSYGETLFGPADQAGTLFIRTLVRGFLAFLSLPVFVLLGVPLIKGAFADLRLWHLRMDGLIVLATLAALTLSLQNTFSGVGQVYYDTATMVLVLVMFGRRLEARARTQGRDAASYLLECLPARALRLLPEGQEEEVAPERLRPQDRVRLLPGAAAPADLLVRAGHSSVVSAHLTGEETPRAVGPGDEVPAGALNTCGLLEGEVLHPAREGSLGRIRQLLAGPLALTPTTKLADRLAGWLTGLALLLAFGGGLWALSRAGLAQALSTGLSVLLVACPCALGLAVPLAYRAVRAALARQGVLVHDLADLEAGALVRHILLDKTGTLTVPLELELCAGRVPRERLQAVLKASGHALGEGTPWAGPFPSALRILPGTGAQATLEGHACRLGRPEWMDQDKLIWEHDVRSCLESLAGDPGTFMAYAEDGRVKALGRVRQGIKPGSVAGIKRLQERDFALEILSGDRAEAVAALGAQLGLAARGGLLPEEKLARVRELQEGGERVMVVGDGVNDAPALLAADVGVAVASGTAAARSQAGVELMGGDLSRLPDFLEAARLLRRTARGNLLWALLYNSVALGLATCGLLHPLVAVVAMLLSSLAVSLRSFRLLDFKGSQP